MKNIRTLAAVVAVFGMSSLAQAGLFGGRQVNCDASKSCDCAPTFQPIVCRPQIMRPCHINTYNYQRECAKPICTNLYGAPGSCGPMQCGPPNCGPMDCQTAWGVGCSTGCTTGCVDPNACNNGCVAGNGCVTDGAGCAPGCNNGCPTGCMPRPCNSTCNLCGTGCGMGCGTGCLTGNGCNGGACLDPNACGDPNSCVAAPTCCPKMVDDCCRIAELIYESQTACYARQRAAAIHKLGDKYSCCCHPEILAAFIYALNDSDERVRAKAADEIGDQIRRNHCCCNACVVQALTTSLADCDRRVRREAEQALRLCGYDVVDGCCKQKQEMCCVTDPCVADPCCPNTNCAPVGTAPAAAPANIPTTPQAPMPPTDDAAPAPAPPEEPKAFFPNQNTRQISARRSLSNLFGLAR